jgi:hypothetical protein
MKMLLRFVLMTYLKCLESLCDWLDCINDDDDDDDNNNNDRHTLRWCIKINLLTSAVLLLGGTELEGQASGSVFESFLLWWTTISVMAVDKHILIVYAFATARKLIMATT